MYHGLSVPRSCGICRAAVPQPIPSHLHASRRSFLAPPTSSSPPTQRFQLPALALDAASYDECDENFGEYCSIGPDGRPQKLSIGEKERLLVQSSAAFSRGLLPSLTDAEYDNLKEELLWQGSDMSLLSPEELLFLDTERSVLGALSDAEYDQLKAALKVQGSGVVVRGPRCSLRSRKVFSDARQDDTLSYLATGAVFVVAANALTATSAALGITDAIGLTLSMALALPLGYFVADVITRSALRDRTLMIASCPSCGKTVRAVIATGEGAKNHDYATCSSCSSRVQFRTDTLEVVLLRTSNREPRV